LWYSLGLCLEELVAHLEERRVGPELFAGVVRHEHGGVGVAQRAHGVRQRARRVRLAGGPFRTQHST
jgi:hypothetical protein